MNLQSKTTAQARPSVWWGQTGASQQGAEDAISNPCHIWQLQLKNSLTMEDGALDPF